MIFSPMKKNHALERYFKVSFKNICIWLNNIANIMQFFQKCICVVPSMMDYCKGAGASIYSHFIKLEIFHRVAISQFTYPCIIPKTIYFAS